jgi:hypothetical protein
MGIDAPHPPARSIYAKAGVAGQLDVVRLLLAPEPDKPPRLAS